MNTERLIVQNINKSRLHEGLEAQSWNVPNNVMINVDDPELLVGNVYDNLAAYAIMLDKGYGNLPESTSEKRAIRDLEDKLIASGIKVDKVPTVDDPKLPGEIIKD